MRKIAVVFSLVLGCGLADAAPLRSQDGARPNSREIVFENDIFIGIVPGRPHSDREYTQGIWLATERSDAPAWGGLIPSIPTCASGGATATSCLQTRFEFGQKMFTPYIQASPAPATERPYAGWLFGAITANVAQMSAARSLRIEMGVTGPPSLAEQFQKIVHRLTRYPQPKGWDQQLAFEPGLLLRYDERRVLEYRSDSGPRLADLIFTGSATVGTVRTGVSGSVALRSGNRVPHPWLRREAADSLAVYGLVELQRQWTARDLFLDGNTFEDSPSVDRIAHTGTVSVGLAGEYRDVRLKFVLVLEDKLYETQPRLHRYGSLSLTVHP